MNIYNLKLKTFDNFLSNLAVLVGVLDNVMDHPLEGSGGSLTLGSGRSLARLQLIPVIPLFLFVVGRHRFLVALGPEEESEREARLTHRPWIFDRKTWPQALKRAWASR